MSFYSYKNANPCCCPGTITNGSALDGLQEKVCVQVKRVYDSCLQHTFSCSPSSALPLVMVPGQQQGLAFL